MSEGERLTLRSSPEKSVTWLYIRQDGSLVVEWYDYSSDAQCHFGNDVAFLLIVASTDKVKIWSLLAEQQNSASDAAMSDGIIKTYYKPQPRHIAPPGTPRSKTHRFAANKLYFRDNCTR